MVKKGRTFAPRYDQKDYQFKNPLVGKIFRGESSVVSFPPCYPKKGYDKVLPRNFLFLCGFDILENKSLP